MRASSPDPAPRLCRALGVAVLLVLCAGPAAAEMRVIESNTPDVKVDEMLPDNAKPELGAGCRVRVLKLPSNETAVLEGPKLARPPAGGTRSKPTPLPCR